MSTVADALRAGGSIQRGELWQCPAHDDRNPSLRVSEGADGRTLVHCHAGCHVDDVLKALDLSPADLYPDRDVLRGQAVTPVTRTLTPLRTVQRVEHIADYVYTLADGSPAVKVARYHQLDQLGAVIGKTFRQSTWHDGAWRAGLNGQVPPLYRLPEVLTAVRDGRPVVIVEGEKDADAGARHGLVTTTCAMGAGKWREAYNAVLAGASVIVVADDDQPGHRHAQAVREALSTVARSVLVVLPAAGCKDLSDHLAAGYGMADVRVFDGRPAAPRTGARALLMRANVKRAQWTWSGRIPVGALTLLAGRAGVGKSLVLCWLTARITRGELPGEWLGTPRAVGYAATEDSWDYTVTPRLIAAGADIGLVYRIDATDDDGERGLILPTDTATLAREIRDYGIAMLALDPLMSTIGAAIDTHRNRELRVALEPLSAMAAETGCSVVGLAHLNKSSGVDPLTLITGSAAFGEVARAALGVVRDPDADESTFVLTQIKNNLGRLDLPSLVYAIDSAQVDADDGGVTEVGAVRFTGETDRHMADILGEPRRADSGLSAAAKWLRSYLEAQGGQALARDVYEAAEGEGIPSHTVSRARRKIGAETDKVGFQGAWLWLLKGDTKKTEVANPHSLLPLSSLADRGTCSVCHTSMVIYEPGQTTHPSCDGG